MDPIHESNPRKFRPSTLPTKLGIGLAISLWMGPLGCFEATPFMGEDTDSSSLPSSTTHESLTAESSTTTDFTDSDLTEGTSDDGPSATETSSESTNHPSTGESSGESSSTGTGESTESSSSSTSTSSTAETDSNTETEDDSNNTSTSGDETTEDSGADENSESSTGSDPECRDHSDCDGDPQRPYCEPNSGQCVQCLSNQHCSQENAPFCHPEQHQCEPCTEIQGQCGEAACHVAEGSCLPQDQVWYVDASANNCNDSGPGSKTVPFCKLHSATAKIGSTQDKSGTLHLLGGKTYNNRDDISAGGAVAILGDGHSKIESIFDIGYILYVRPDNTAYLANLSFMWNETSTGGQQLLCGEANLWLHHVSFIGGKQGSGLSGESCDIKISGSVFEGGTDTHDFAVWAKNSIIDIENSILTSAGDGPENTALAIKGDSTITLNYSTIIGNHNAKEGGHAIRCEEGSNNKIRVRNSLILDRAEVSSFDNCGDLNVSYSALSDGSKVSGSTNKILQPLPDLAKLFVDPFGVPANLNLLKPGVGSVDQLQDVALRTSDKDPKVDINGQSRPAVGQRDWPGADMAD